MEKLGLRQISSAGQAFDPSMHQAVAQVESSTLEPNMVVDEFQKDISYMTGLPDRPW